MMPAHNIDNAMTGKIINIVCEAWGVTRADLVSRSRRQPLPWARSMLCHYLRRYAGHDTVSCAALLHISAQSVQGYDAHYIQRLRTFIPFRDRDEQVQKQCRQLCNRTK